MTTTSQQKTPTQATGTAQAKGGTAKLQSCTTKTDNSPAAASYGGHLGTFERLELHVEVLSRVLRNR